MASLELITNLKLIDGSARTTVPTPEELPLGYMCFGIVNSRASIWGNYDGSVHDLVEEGTRQVVGSLNLENGTGVGSLKQKSISYTELNAYIRPAVIAYLMSQGMPQQMAEQVADGDITQEGSTRYILAGMGITGDVSNTNYGVASAIFGGNNANGDSLDPNKGIASLINGFSNTNTGMAALVSGQGLLNETDGSAIFGTSDIFRADKYTGDDREYARKFLINLQRIGFIDTGKTEEQIKSGQVDAFEVNFGSYKNGKALLSSGINASDGSSLGTLLGYHNAVKNADHFFISGNQNTLTRDNAVILGGQQNYNESRNSAIISGELNAIKGNGHGNIILGGYDNIIERNNPSNCLVAGESNRLRDGDLKFAFGYGLNNDWDIKGKIVLGRNNDEKSTTILEVGNGSSYSSRSNAFEVLEDGRTKVYGAPVENNDVVRYQDKATASVFGLVKPDGTTITVNNGIISASGGGGGGGGASLYCHKVVCTIGRMFFDLYILSSKSTAYTDPTNLNNDLLINKALFINGDGQDGSIYAFTLTETNFNFACIPIPSTNAIVYSGALIDSIISDTLTEL